MSARPESPRNATRSFFDDETANPSAFGEKRAAKGSGGGAECRAESEFGFAADGAGEEEIRNIGAGDEEEQSGCGEKNPEHGVRARVDLIVHARHGEV